MHLDRRHVLLGALVSPAAAAMLAWPAQAAQAMAVTRKKPPKKPRPRRTEPVSVIVYDGAQLKAALDGAIQGDRIILAPGPYAGGGPLAVRAARVTLEALKPLAAVLRLPLAVEAAGVAVDGLAFEGTGVSLAGDDVRLTRCRIRGSVDAAVLITAGRSVRVAWCEVAGFTGRGIFVKLVGTGPATVSAPLIDHNHIHDSVGSGGAGEAIQLSEAMKDSDKRLGAVVEHNLVERVGADSEALGVKCSGNTIRFNTLRDCRGCISNRHGEDNSYIANTVERSYAITIQDRGNRLIGNRCISSLDRRGIRIMGGNAMAGNTTQGAHPQAVGTYLAGNEADRLIIGHLFAGHTLPAVGTVVAGHRGPIQLKAQVGTRFERAPVEVPAPVWLDPTLVGPAATGAAGLAG